MVDTKNQYLAIKKEVDQAIQEVLDSAAYINGKAVKDFAQNLSAYLKVNYVIPCANGTDALQIAMMALGLQPGDEIILTVMEHHSNLIPWQMIAEKTGAVLRFVQLTPSQNFDLEHFQTLLSDRTRLVSCVHVSNTLGCITPLAQIIPLAHDRGAKVLVDACQSVPHLALDVQALDCDWLVASSHKMCGPTGVGFLYGKLACCDRCLPFWGGAK